MKTPSGSYLVTFRNHIFLDRPEIFLLFEMSGDLWGICINKHLVENGDEKLLSVYVDEFKNHGLEIAPETLQAILFDGGRKNSAELGAINTGTVEDFSKKQPVEYMYNIVPFDKFSSNLKRNQIPIRFVFFTGMEKLDRNIVKENISAGNWEQRFGFHAITYSKHADVKINSIDLLTRQYFKISKDMSDIISLMREIMHMASPYIMRAGVASYCKARHPEFSDSEILDTTRMMVAVSNAEGNDITDVMEKYTHQEVIALYRKLTEKGKIFDLLNALDEQIKLLRSLRINHMIYDDEIARIILKDSSDVSRTDNNMEGQLENWADIIKG